jgi:hypothetical protein
VFGKKAGSVINLKSVFYLANIGLTDSGFLFFRFFAKPETVTKVIQKCI